MTKKYGEIFDVVPRSHIVNGELQSSSFVFFERSERIDRMSYIPVMEINGAMYPVKWINVKDRWGNFPQPAKVIARELLRPPGMHSYQRMLDLLDDDCLYEIFKKDTIDLEDLLRIAETCKRFQNVAQLVYRSKYRGPGYRVQIPDYWSLQRMESFFRIFGGSCNRFWLMNRPYKHTSIDVIWEIIAKHCTALVDIKVSSGNLPESPRFHSMLSKLEILRMDSSLCDLNILFAANSQLIMLDLYECNLRFPSKRLPKLLEITLKQCYNLGSANSMRRFFKQNSQLLYLDMTLNYFERNFRMTNAIKYLVNLEKFKWIWNDDVNIMDSLSEVHHFERLGRLRNLIIREDLNALNHLMTANVTRESLNVQLIPYQPTMNPTFQFKFFAFSI